MQNTKVPSASDCLSPLHHSPGRFWLKKPQQTQFWCLWFFFLYFFTLVFCWIVVNIFILFSTYFFYFWGYIITSFPLPFSLSKFSYMSLFILFHIHGPPFSSVVHTHTHTRIHACIPTQICITYSVFVMLLVHKFLKLIICYWIIISALFPEENSL